jgi:glycosyltransferase involved in cell wall biosynthesis
MNPAIAPRMSIVVGTLNRGEVLGRSLDSLLAQDFPRDRYEIIVVDNGCTDGTEALVRKRMATAENLRYVKEPKLGLSNARNKGIAESRFELVGFFDDDATAQRDWLTRLTTIFANEPGIGAAGGPIFVGWPTTRPEWMPPSCEGYFGHCYYGDQRIELQFPRYPYGSNMVIRKEHLLAINGFSDKVGPKGGNMMSAGEQDLFSRLYKIPIRVMYDPAAPVEHWVQAERVSRSWVMKRSYKHGLSNTRMISNDETWSLGNLLRRLFNSAGRCVMSGVAAAMGWLMRKPPAVTMGRFANMMYWAGITRGTLSTLGQAGRGSNQ